MYDEIGKKIKSLARAAFIIESIIFILAGAILIGMDEDVALIGFLVAIIGPIVAWISSWILYGFGELVDKVTNLEKYFCKKVVSQNQKQVNIKNAGSNNVHMSVCNFCEKHTETTRVKISDKMGVRYRNLCEECIKKTEQEGSIITYDPS